MPKITKKNILLCYLNIFFLNKFFIPDAKNKKKVKNIFYLLISFLDFKQVL